MAAATRAPRKAAKPTQPEPTREQMALAYRVHRTHQWPETADAAIAHPVYGVCLRQAARQMHRMPVCSHPQPLRVGTPGAYIPPTPVLPPAPKAARVMNPRPGSLGAWSARTTVDLKKRAAHDAD